MIDWMDIVFLVIIAAVYAATSKNTKTALIDYFVIIAAFYIVDFLIGSLFNIHRDAITVIVFFLLMNRIFNIGAGIRMFIDKRKPV